MSGMSPEVAAQLRAPFAAEQVGKLPRIICPECSEARGRCCDEHTKSKCGDCGSYITERHIHLDYVGHADVTNRLLDVDPEWAWEPFATDSHGLPLCDTTSDGSPVGLWLRLTVAGVTRIGYGSCPANQNDAVKVLIGDALRNAAMRFGVATDLWAKGDRSDPSAENATASAGKASRRSQAAAPERTSDAEWLARFDALVTSATTTEELDAIEAEGRKKYDELRLTVEDARGMKKALDARRGELVPA
jgi:hypothetical protein